MNPICSTARCTWPDYGSLGICVEVINVTDSANVLLLRAYFKEVIQRLQSNLVVGMPTVYPAFIATWPSPSNMFNETVGKAAIVEHWIAFSDTMINLTDYVNIDTSSFQFFTTAFFFCTKTLSCNVELGVPHISEVSSTVNILSSPVGSLNIQWNESDLFFDNGTCKLGGKSMVLGGSTSLTTETYTVDVCTGLMLSNAFWYMTSGWYMTTDVILFSRDFAFALDTGPMSPALGLALFGEPPITVIKDPATQFDNVRHMMENVAGSMTNALVYLAFSSLNGS